MLVQRRSYGHAVRFAAPLERSGPLLVAGGCALLLLLFSLSPAIRNASNDPTSPSSYPSTRQTISRTLSHPTDLPLQKSPRRRRDSAGRPKASLVKQADSVPSSVVRRERVPPSSPRPRHAAPTSHKELSKPTTSTRRTGHQGRDYMYRTEAAEET